VLESGLEGQPVISGAYAAPVLGGDGLVAPATITAVEAKRRIDVGSAVLLDLARSLDYRDSHPEGAWWACRTAIADNLAKIPSGAALILTAPEPMLASLTAADLAASGREVLLLDAGRAGWSAAGLAMQSGMTAVLSEPQDTYLRPYDRTNRADIEKAMNDYLDWEVALVEQIKKAGGLSFRQFA